MKTKTEQKKAQGWFRQLKKRSDSALVRKRLQQKQL